MTGRIFRMLSLLALSFLALFFALALFSRLGDPIGLIDDKLAHCPNAPHCVCSEYQADTHHYVEPVPISTDSLASAMAIASKVIEQQGGKIVKQPGNYLAATFSSSFFGFVDDVELRLDTDQELLHLRSSSRVGYSDMGVNKKRAIMLSQLLTKQIERGSFDQ